MSDRLTQLAGFGLALLALAISKPTMAADVDVDLELVLAVDVSRSMDAAEQQLQRQGYVNAFRHPEVIRAIAGGTFGRIAVTYVEWSDPGFRSLLVPWTLVADSTDAENLAAMLEAAPITRDQATSISSGLLYAAGQFDDNGFRGMRQTVDVSGDGPNNAGYPVDSARDLLVRRGITINGLPIMLTRQDPADGASIPDLDVYYEHCVIGGPGAFMITVDDAARFEVAIRRKMVLEISGLPPRLILAAMIAPEPRMDCLVGEKARRASISRER
jgi:Protein of unknown function (DUF1194)